LTSDAAAGFCQATTVVIALAGLAVIGIPF
jgi:hypothetical protein